MAASEHDGRASHKGAVELLWGSQEKPTRGPRPVLTVAIIVETAIQVADADGMEAVSMQRVAGALQVTKMALYRYVSSKAELVAVMTEVAVGEPPNLDAVAGGWRPRLEQWAEQLRATWQSHPWIPSVTVGDRLTGPREIGWTESAVAALSDTGLSGTERMDAVFLLSGHVRNTQYAAGTQPWTMERRLNPLVADLVRLNSDRFPAIVTATSANEEGPGDNGWSFGLERILDGIELLIARRRPKSRKR